MGRKKQYASVSERVRAFRERHKPIKYITISKGDYLTKKQKSIEQWNRIYEVSEEQVLKSYEAYKKFWLGHFDIDIRLLWDSDYEEEHKISWKVTNDIECGDSPQSKIDHIYRPSFGGKSNPFLGYGIPVSVMYLILEECELIKCPYCAVSFVWLESNCPKCGAMVKIEEKRVVV